MGTALQGMWSASFWIQARFHTCNLQRRSLCPTSSFESILSKERTYVLTVRVQESASELIHVRGFTIVEGTQVRLRLGAQPLVS